jgi:hypothetical protein
MIPNINPFQLMSSITYVIPIDNLMIRTTTTKKIDRYYGFDNMGISIFMRKSHAKENLYLLCFNCMSRVILTPFACVSVTILP